MRPRRWPSHLLIAVALVMTVGASTARGQVQERDRATHARFLALNVAIGTTASIARAVVTGAPLRTTIAKGLLGGSLMSTGMELVGTESPAVRFAGLQLTAIGASVSRNADSGTPIFSDLTLPVYPFYLRVRPGSSSPVTARLSAMRAARLATGRADGRSPRMAGGASLATGAPVLRSPRWRLPSASCPAPCEGAFAQHNAGVIVYSSSAGTDYDLRRTLAHESMHVLQHTRDVVFHAIPASDALLSRAGRTGRILSRFLVADFLLPMRFLDEAESRLRGSRPRDSWYEVEARAFAPGGE